MTRRFAAEPQVPARLVADLIDLAARAPSAGNTQAADYLVLREATERAAFWAAATPTSGRHRHTSREMAHDGVANPWLAGVSAAPTLVVCLADEDAYRRRYAEPDKGAVPPADQDWPIPHWITDAGMGAMLLLLGAHDAGLGALFFGIPGARHDAVRAAFGIPAGRSLVGVIALGHEAERVRGRSLDRARRRGPEVTHWGRFGVATPPGPPPSATMPTESTTQSARPPAVERT